MMSMPGEWQEGCGSATARTRITRVGAEVVRRGIPDRTLPLDLLGSDVESERQQLARLDAHETIWAGEDDTNVWVVVGEDLPIPTAGTPHPPPVAPDGDHMGQLCRPSGPRRSERHELRARPSREREHIDPDDDPTVRRANRGSQGVHAVFVVPCVGGRVGDRSGRFDEGHLVGGLAAADGGSAFDLLRP
jgi:hypothetical protein